ncbi:MAG TPA: CTP synthase [Candidatus Saccharimonadales bacterium]|nr:CTP synthase [Candidatus Saccharimonadales bacterium]
MRAQKTHYVFVTGGVISGLGKGITAASLGAVFRAQDIKVSMQKLDVYLNFDAGTLNPAEHGECFVTKDGAETDLDLGHYERFLDEEMTQASSTMSGRLFSRLIDDERAGKYLGKTVQMVPHFTKIIQDDIIASGKGSDIHIVEIGGTVGDIESTAFMEAIREMNIAFPGRCAYAHVVYAPFLGTSKEFKTKPVQNALRDLRNAGIVPDLTLVRAENQPPQSVADKIAMFGGVARNSVIMLPNARTVYQVPLTLEEHGAAGTILNKFGLKMSKPNMSRWDNLVKLATTKYDKNVRIGIVAKYLDNEDTYFCVMEALRSAAWANKVNLQYSWIDAEKLEKGETEALKKVDGILVPGGFGSRGLEGKIAAATYAMENNVPYLGICLGLQMAVVAAARKGGLKNAQTSEVDPKTENPVIYIMDDQQGKEATGGTMRLGNYTCKLAKGSLAEKIYGSNEIVERHRHRYEVNQKYKEFYEKAGLVVSGLSPNGKLVEMVEIPGHKYFIATQAHPEFRSRPDRVHPLFDGFIKAAMV